MAVYWGSLIPLGQPFSRWLCLILVGGKHYEFSEYETSDVNAAGSLNKQRYSCVSCQIGKCLNPGLKREAELSSASLKIEKLNADS